LACVYRHIRKDLNTTFYVGIGNTTDRARSKIKRNKHWYSIVNKTDYEIEILYDDISWEEAKEKEIELISLYKRKTNGGTLCNMTDGGDGSIGCKHTIEAIEKMSRSHGAALKTEDVLKIRELYSNGGCTHRSLAEKFEVTKQCITSIVTNRTWKNIS
jgi:DNA-binding XRE family transcriptional regulator